MCYLMEYIGFSLWPDDTKGMAAMGRLRLHSSRAGHGNRNEILLFERRQSSHCIAVNMFRRGPIPHAPLTYYTYALIVSE